MNPVDPKPPDLSWFERVVYAANQQPYQPLPSVRNKMPIAEGGMGEVISVWEPDDYELQLLTDAIARGERPKITLTVCTFGQPLQPVYVVAGERSLAWYAATPEPRS